MSARRRISIPEIKKREVAPTNLANSIISQSSTESETEEESTGSKADTPISSEQKYSERAKASIHPCDNQLEYARSGKESWARNLDRNDNGRTSCFQRQQAPHALQEPRCGAWGDDCKAAANFNRVVVNSCGGAGTNSSSTNSKEVSDTQQSSLNVNRKRSPTADESNLEVSKVPSDADWFDSSVKPEAHLWAYISAAPRGMTNPPGSVAVREKLLRDLNDYGVRITTDWPRPMPKGLSRQYEESTFLPRPASAPSLVSPVERRQRKFSLLDESAPTPRRRFSPQNQDLCAISAVADARLQSSGFPTTRWRATRSASAGDSRVSKRAIKGPQPRPLQSPTGGVTFSRGGRRESLKGRDILTNEEVKHETSLLKVRQVFGTQRLSSAETNFMIEEDHSIVALKSLKRDLLVGLYGSRQTGRRNTLGHSNSRRGSFYAGKTDVQIDLLESGIPDVFTTSRSSVTELPPRRFRP